MQRFIPVSSAFGARPRSTVAEAQERIAKNVTLPTGYRLVWAGEYLEWQQAKHRLEIVVPLSLVLIMVLLLGLFNSLRDSLLALAGIPFAMGGGVIALFVSNQPLVLVNRRFHLVVRRIGHERNPDHHLLRSAQDRDWARRHRSHGPRRRAADAAAADDLTGRCIGLLPSALSTGIGSQVQRPLHPWSWAVCPSGRFCCS